MHCRGRADGDQKADGLSGVWTAMHAGIATGSAYGVLGRSLRGVLSIQATWSGSGDERLAAWRNGQNSMEFSRAPCRLAFTIASCWAMVVAVNSRPNSSSKSFFLRSTTLH